MCYNGIKLITGLWVLILRYAMSFACIRRLLKIRLIGSFSDAGLGPAFVALPCDSALFSLSDFFTIQCNIVGA